ncbi:MAG: low molecular weight protein-tyrosine-phosphatase [Gemmobacter sp.]
MAQNAMAAPRILFVCLGNICRSPTAEGVFRTLAAREGLNIGADSCALSHWHIGAPPHPDSIAAAARRGHDLTALRARRIEAADFIRFSHVLVMDHANLAAAQTLCPPGGTAPCLLMDYAPQAGRTDIPDPWHTGDFEETLNLIEAACTGLVQALAKSGTSGHPAQ